MVSTSSGWTAERRGHYGVPLRGGPSRWGCADPVRVSGLTLGPIQGVVLTVSLGGASHWWRGGPHGPVPYSVNGIRTRWARRPASQRDSVRGRDWSPTARRAAGSGIASGGAGVGSLVVLGRQDGIRSIGSRGPASQRDSVRGRDKAPTAKRAAGLGSAAWGSGGSLLVAVGRQDLIRGDGREGPRPHSGVPGTRQRDSATGHQLSGLVQAPTVANRKAGA